MGVVISPATWGSSIWNEDVYRVFLKNVDPPVAPPKIDMSPKKGTIFQRKLHLPTINFQGNSGDMLVFQGGYYDEKNLMETCSNLSSQPWGVTLNLPRLFVGGTWGHYTVPTYHREIQVLKKTAGTLCEQCHSTTSMSHKLDEQHTSKMDKNTIETYMYNTYSIHVWYIYTFTINITYLCR